MKAILNERPQQKLQHIDAVNSGVLYRAYDGKDQPAGVALGVRSGLAVFLCPADGISFGREITNRMWRFERADDITITLENTGV